MAVNTQIYVPCLLKARRLIAVINGYKSTVVSGGVPGTFAGQPKKPHREDETIKEALLEKQKLVTDILHVPTDEFNTITNVAAEPAYDEKPSELIAGCGQLGQAFLPVPVSRDPQDSWRAYSSSSFAVSYAANLLTGLQNERLGVTMEDAIATGNISSS